MKFILSDGEQLRDRLETFPEYYKNALSHCKILVVCLTNDNDVVGACGLSNISNYALAYVKEEYRGRGLGTKIEAKTYNEARKRGLSFVAGSISFDNVPALRVASKVGFRETMRLKTYGWVLLIIPFNFRGEIVYAFLRAICSKLPETFLYYIIRFSMSIVGWIRRGLSASWARG